MNKPLEGGQIIIQQKVPIIVVRKKGIQMSEVVKQLSAIGSLVRKTYQRARRIYPLVLASREHRFSKRKLANINQPYGKQFAHVLTLLKSGDADDGRDLLLEIERERECMLLRNEPLIDGSLGEGGLYDKSVSIQTVCRASKPFRPALLMYLLVREFSPTNVLELGTNVGISSAYQAAALIINGQDGKIVTLEASPYRLRLARELHRKLGLKNIHYKEGLFAETLKKTLNEFGPIDFAFIDGHHQYQPTLDYFDMIWKYSLENAIYVFDDIRWSDGMKQAWSAIQADKRVALAIDFYSIGICVCTRQPSAKRYVISPIRYALSEYGGNAGLSFKA